MPRTLKANYSRSSGLKRDKEERGWVRIADKASHNSHKNANIKANEITFEKFNCKRKQSSWMSSQEVYNPGDLKYSLDDYDWKKETLVEFLERRIAEIEDAQGTRRRDYSLNNYVNALKQLTRRGETVRFVSHGRRFKALDDQI